MAWPMLVNISHLVPTDIGTDLFYELPVSRAVSFSPGRCLICFWQKVQFASSIFILRNHCTQGIVMCSIIANRGGKNHKGSLDNRLLKWIYQLTRIHDPITSKIPLSKIPLDMREFQCTMSPWFRVPILQPISVLPWKRKMWTRPQIILWRKCIHRRTGNEKFRQILDNVRPSWHS
jgi:hypothetical protein